MTLRTAFELLAGFITLIASFRWAHVETELRRFLAREKHAQTMRDKWGPKPASPEDGARRGAE